MTTVVYDPITFEVLRIDLSTIPPTGEGVANAPDVIGWPSSPAKGLTLRWRNGLVWEDDRTLAEQKIAKWQDIKRSRDATEMGTFFYNGMVFDGDLDAQRRLASYISISKSAIAAGEQFSAEFTLADDTVVTLNAVDFVGIEMAKVQAVATAFAQARTLRTQLNAATTPEEIQAVVWPTI